MRNDTSFAPTNHCLGKLLCDERSLHHIMNKITIVGVGNLGSCIAYEIAGRGIADKIVLVDVYQELAEGNAADISQAMAFRNNTEVVAGNYEDANGSKVVVFTAGKPRTPDMKSRMELLEANKKIIMSVATNLKQLGGTPTIITLTNPVDVMNYVMWKSTDSDRKKVLGSAGMLDSARFRTILSNMYDVPIFDVDAYVIGEHGDNQIPVFSQVAIKKHKKRFTEEERLEIMSRLKESALQVISKKGATIYAPASNTANMIEAILKDEKKVFICSVVLDEEYSLKGVSLGVPVVLGCEGVEKVVEWDLDDYERKLFYKGAEQLKETIKTMAI